MATTTLPVARAARPAVLYPHAQWYFLFAMATTWLGFAQSYFAVVRTEPLLHHIHGAVMGGWIALLVVQPILYQRGRLRLHHTLGYWGVYLLVPAIVVCGLLMDRRMLRGSSLPPFILHQLAYLDLVSLLLFPSFVALSIYFARDLQLHARYIVCTVLLLMPPAWARALFLLPFMHSFQRNVNTALVLVDLVLLVLIAADARQGKVRAPYPVALVLFTAMSVSSNFVSGWSWWRTVEHALAAAFA